MKNRWILLLFSIVLFVSCKSKEAAPDDEETTAAITPVTVTHISTDEMTDYIDLNATSAYLQKWYVKANVNGYIQTANVQLNKPVSAGQVLFTIKTKEAQSIGNTISVLDTSLKFSGINKIPAAAGGFISEINHQPGDYVLDGEQLAAITDTRSFVFLLNMPYELRPYIVTKKTLDLLLPDGEKLTGIITGIMPSMDSASQTQRVILKVNSPHPIPENLIAKVRIIKSDKSGTQSLPKAAVLTNETQDEFWVMKMLDSTTAVKVPVTKGIENDDKVEILSPQFTAADRVVVTGNYGLADTAKVKIIQ
ncbi:MAG: HlyD family efflux transporter periplasmic adaptor subunit [Bacteroidetes bacterium]|nr:HlyD family efflux transporter periplasmic adaptor subunit [Bacteroidota bacterium]